MGATALFGLNPALAQPTDLTQGKPVGSARLTVFGFEIYNARLWVAPGFRRDAYAQHPLTLELSYLRNFSGVDIAERSIKEMRRIEGFADDQAPQWLAELKRTLPDVKKGERLTGVYQPGEGLRFLFNDKPLANIKDPLLARVFMGIWLSPRTSEPQMRDALLAEASP